MGLEHVEETADACCPRCNSLGSLHIRDDAEVHRPSLTVLRGLSFDDFCTSAEQGCFFCGVVLQSFLLLQLVTAGMRVELLLYANSPVELHSSGGKDYHEVIEIYPCSTHTRPTFRTVGNDVPRESTVRASINFLRGNYYNCVTGHEECVRGPSCLPKRIVDISRSRYRVVEPPVGTQGMYATLSYTWGSSGFAMTTSGNYDEMKLGFEREKLPIAFLDAAKMAQSLDICYIWIDTLCIIQDSKTDWEEQAAKMGQIFEGAAITIAASLSTNPHHSLFQKRDPVYEEVELFSGVKGGPIDVVYKARRKITRGIHAKTGRSTDIDPLDTRGWGLQEKMLSTRLIAFTGAELQWTCRESKSCECNDNPLPVLPLFPAPTGTTTTDEIVKVSKIWSQILEEYSTRELKFSKDRLPALSGLANKFGAETGYTYIAGGWKETLLYDLVWQRDIGPILESSTWLAPSWSWASSPGAVNFRLARHSYPGSRIEHTALVGHYYESACGSPYSRALACSVTVRGHTLPAFLRRSLQDFGAYTIRIGDAVYSPNTDKRATCEFSIDESAPHCNTSGIPGTSEQIRSRMCDSTAAQQQEEPITLLSLYSIHHRRHLYHNFLILEEIPHDVNTYRRIGIGSGKMYRGNGCDHDFPIEMQRVRSFEWLLIDCDKGGRKLGDIVEQVLCIV